MLSFMREHKPEDPKRHQVGKNLEAPADSSKTGGPTRGIDFDATQETQNQEYLTIETHNKNARKSTILLAVLFGIGMLCLWFMIKKSTPQTASASTTNTEETQIEAAIARLTGVESEMSKQMDKIVKKFYEFSDVYQVKVDELAKNPFKIEILLGNMKGKLDSGWKENAAMLRLQAKNLELLSIMQSDRGHCCMIDDKILYEGDSIEGFKVSQIGGDFVKLESESVGNDPNCKEFSGIEIVLKLSE